jgi:hypothetical protein
LRGCSSGWSSAWGSFVIDLAATVGTQVIVEDPPRRFASAGPGAVLSASRSSGLRSTLLIGLAVVLAGVLVGGLLFALLNYYGSDDDLLVHFGLIFRLAFGVVFGVVSGVAVGLAVGLDAWLFHYWLRWRLAARGVLPARLPAFLRWCAEDERAWLRISDAYEFRHRELLEYLAQTRDCTTDTATPKVREG